MPLRGKNIGIRTQKMRIFPHAPACAAKPLLRIKKTQARLIFHPRPTRNSRGPFPLLPHLAMRKTVV